MGKRRVMQAARKWYNEVPGASSVMGNPMFDGGGGVSLEAPWATGGSSCSGGGGIWNNTITATGKCLEMVGQRTAWREVLCACLFKKRRSHQRMQESPKSTITIVQSPGGLCYREGDRRCLHGRLSFRRDV